MVPTLNKQDIQDRINNATKLASGGSYVSSLRKRNLNGSTSLENRLRMKTGKLMNSKARPELSVLDKTEEKQNA